MSTSRSGAWWLAAALKGLLLCLLGSFGSQAMAARECWGAVSQTGNIGFYYDDALRSNCYNDEGTAFAAIIASANVAGKVPSDFGNFTRTVSFAAEQCAGYPDYGSSIPAVLCHYTGTLTNTYSDGGTGFGGETKGSVLITLGCGEWNKKAPIGSTVFSCKSILDIYGTATPPSCSACVGSPTVGNPVDALTGIKRQTEPLLSWGRGHSLSMTYVGTLPTVGGNLTESGAHSFGPHWFSNLHRRGVQEYHEGNVWLFQRGNGVWKRFGQYVGSDDASQRDPLPVSVPYYQLYRDMASGAIETYRMEDLTLVSIAYIDGRRLDIAGSVHPAAGKQIDNRYLIDSVTDESGRSVSFQYKSIDRRYSAIERVTDPAGVPLLIAYDDVGNLTSVTYPDQKSRQYLYENASFPTLMTGRIDEGNGRIGTYRYDSSGRAIETQTGSLPPWKIRWPVNPPDPQPAEYYDPELDKIIRIHPLSMPRPTQAEVTAPNGTQSTLDGVVAGRSAFVGARSQPGGAGSAASTSSAVFDQAGNATQSDDFNGGRTCKTFDPARNLEVVRFDGVSTATACASVSASSIPAGARMVSTQWHPDWRMSTRTAEPRRITTLVYNGQPDPFNGNALAFCAPADALLPDGKPIVVLCKRVEQATTDDTGALGFIATPQSGVPARATKWTYNATGQVLTETDPLNRIVVTNEYYTDTTADHTKGDLKSSKNAVNQLTTFTRYNAYGKLLESVDANSVATTYTYDPRQRVTSVTTAGATTGYEYLPTGLLKKSTQPDGSAVNYEYDDAHRLFAAFDTRGNRVDYTLDQSGNRTSEVAKDPNGALKRSMSRAFDALGRAQQMTGRE